MRVAEVVSQLRRRLPEILPAEDIRWPAGDLLDGPCPVIRVSLLLKGRSLQLIVGILGLANLARVRDAGERLRSWPHKGDGVIPLLVAPHLNEEARRLCKGLRLAYLDLSGNAWIDQGPFLIEKEVPRNLYPHESWNRSPFADKASLILRYLLQKPGQAGRVLEIARAVALSPGYVSKVLHASEGLSYVWALPSGEFRLRNIPELLADWSAFYHGQRNRVDSFFLEAGGSGDIEARLRPILSGLNGYALSFHSGNNRVDPFVQSNIWHIYFQDEGVIRKIIKRLPLESVAGDAGNFIILHPYYRESVFYGARQVGAFRVVSDLQLYLDLRHYPLRGREAADRIYDRRLSIQWKSGNE